MTAKEFKKIIDNNISSNIYLRQSLIPSDGEIYREITGVIDIKNIVMITIDYRGFTYEYGDSLYALRTEWLVEEPNTTKDFNFVNL